MSGFLVAIYELLATFVVFPFRTTPAYPPLIHRVSTAYPPHSRIVSLFGRCGGCAAGKRRISGGSAGVRFSLIDLFQHIRCRFGRDGLFLDHVAHMGGLNDLPEGSHVHMHVLQLPRSPAPNGNVSAFPQTNFHLRRNENLHFTLYLQGCSDFHAPRIGEPPRNAIPRKLMRRRVDAPRRSVVIYRPTSGFCRPERNLCT